MGQLTSYHVIKVPTAAGSPGVTSWAVSHIPKQSWASRIFTVVHAPLDALLSA